MMLVYGRNVALEVLKKPKNVKNVILQQGFDDKRILSLIENQIVGAVSEKAKVVVNETKV